MTITLHYGKKTIDIPLADTTMERIETISYLNMPTIDPQRTIEQALLQPIGTMPLRQLARDKKNAVILISDMTRLCPSYLFLGHLLDELNVGGIPDEQITIIVALGLHRKQTQQELIALVSEAVFRRVTVDNHSALSEDCVHVGTTSNGTPIEINRTVVEAELRIVTGNIEPHRLAGVSGGVKALLPGVASQTCIEHNHALGQHNPAEAGIPINRVHQDMEEALNHIPIHFLFNVIVNHRQEIMAAVTGDVRQAHATGVRIAQKHFIVPTSKKYKVVIASAGGHPKDTQLYQAIKSMVNASKLLQIGGTLLLVARCEELYGNGVFQYWAEVIQDQARIVRMLQSKFVLGAHKIEHLHQILQQHQVYLYSDVPSSISELLGMIPVTDLGQTIHDLTEDTTFPIAYMPFASLTFIQ